ncbi:MAG: cell division protein ZapD [Gammaproteobacteria bacterium]
MDTTQTITYETPFNEHMRFCLRMEQLFQHIEEHLMVDSIPNAETTIETIIEVAYLLDRPDLKSLVTKELIRYQTQLSRLHQLPHIDQSKLANILVELEHIIEQFQTNNNKLGQRLRENDFLSALRVHRLNPGGICHFEIPAYHRWLYRPHAERIEQLTAWYEEIKIMGDAARLMLQLVRNSNDSEDKVAETGLYQQSLDPKAPFQIARVSLPIDSPVHPQISVGRHRMSIQFFMADMQNKPKPTNNKINFKLTNCIF